MTEHNRTAAPKGYIAVTTFAYKYRDDRRDVRCRCGSKGDAEGEGQFAVSLFFFCATIFITDCFSCNTSSKMASFLHSGRSMTVAFYLFSAAANQTFLLRSHKSLFWQHHRKHELRKAEANDN
ncbi:unnamed protein product [Albugo candida]|uniref:Uncharacterized protein n=1 Tax=Albugo candida TaxID=65357 RepID=A0A024FWX4_9STRA|nr:unnamed protein product [Albugo candida]|eukprot:CCI11164.1 unnamed protein product [Albugo candida]